MRLLVGAVGLVAFVAGGGAPSGTRRACLVALWRRPVVWVMGAAVAGYQAFFFIGTARTGVAVGTLIALGSRTVPRRRAGLGAARGRAGVGVGAVDRDCRRRRWHSWWPAASTTGDPLGMRRPSAAGACYAVYTVLGVRLAREGFRCERGPRRVVHASARWSSLPFALTSDVVAARRSGIVEVLWLGLATTTVAYLLFGIGLRALQPGHIATLTLLEPAVATLLGVVVLGEADGRVGLDRLPARGRCPSVARSSRGAAGVAAARRSVKRVR